MSVFDDDAHLRSAVSPRRLLIRTWLGEPRVCARVRILEPNAFLSTIPGVRTLAGVDPRFLGAAGASEGDVFIQQRIIVPLSYHRELQRLLLRAGSLIVAEFDDEPAIFPEFANSDGFAVRSCHCVQVSTEVLAESLRRYNPHVTVFANQIAALAPPRTYRADGPITVFFGALNREADWAPIMPALNRVVDSHAGRLRFKVVHDRGFFEALQTDLKEFEQFCPYERYQEILRTSDVGLLPLNPSPFNAAKSDLKFLECAALGVVCLASPTAYGASIRHGDTGLIARSVEDFASLLARLVEDAPFRIRLAERAYEYVAGQRLLEHHYRERYDWYWEMLDRKPELARDLRSRVPGLFEE